MERMQYRPTERQQNLPATYSLPSDDEIKALEKGIDPTTPPKRPGKRFMTCRRCRQGGYTGEYPFSTAPQTGLCDDCF